MRTHLGLNEIQPSGIQRTFFPSIPPPILCPQKLLANLPNIERTVTPDSPDSPDSEPSLEEVVFRRRRAPAYPHTLKVYHVEVRKGTCNYVAVSLGNMARIKQRKKEKGFLRCQISRLY